MSKQQYKGFYGAKVSSWTRGNPRAVLIKVMEAHPKASREVIVDMFQRTIREEQHVDDLSSIIEQWATNNVNDLENHREKAKPKTRAEIIAEQKKAADRAAAKPSQGRSESPGARHADAERQEAPLLQRQRIEKVRQRFHGPI
jgi:hypothetical protein